MASITYWNRLEPRPIARDLNGTLAARLRDPLWLLARQWQFGEFQGKDAGSPAFATLNATLRPLTGWTTGGAWQPLAADRPLEATLLAEPFDSDDVSLKVELAQTFERELRAAPGSSGPLVDRVLTVLRRSLPLPAAPAGDADATGFLAVCALRSFDGAALFAVSTSDPPRLPPATSIGAGDLAVVQSAQRSFARAVADTFGAIGSADPPAWRPERLEFDASVAVDAPGTTGLVLRVAPSPDGTVDWYALESVPPPAGQRPVGAVKTVQRSVIPGHVSFRGMPNARWWDFESGETDYGDLRVDRRDVGKLVIMDFMLIHGNDWFVVPLEQPVGTAADIQTLSVTDVFGDTVFIPRADDTFGAVRGCWTLFTCADTSSASALVPQLILPPTAGGAVQTSDPLEDVRFFRDELANLVWAVERTITNGVGQPISSHEHDATALPSTGGEASSSGGLRYEIQTPVPRYWIPFMPVTLDVDRGEIALERAAMFDAQTDPPSPIRPRGRILQPPTDPYPVREEEISRAGVRVVRVVCRTRWIDGSTWVWTTRQRRPARGEGSSGLLFDLAL